MDLNAAADFLGTGAIEVPVFEKEIVDLVRRTSVSLQRFPQVPATGHPHRYFEQTAIAVASSVDPRSLAATATGPTRVERPVFIKAEVAQSNLSLFDKDVTEQQGQFTSVVAKDIEDIAAAVAVQRATMVWAGTDTSLIAPTTTQWCGGLTQITQEFTVASGSSIIDGLKTAVATIVANVGFQAKPTAIYLNPLLGDYHRPGTGEGFAHHFGLRRSGCRRLGRCDQHPSGQAASRRRSVHADLSLPAPRSMDSARRLLD